jgi:hypothetical protein
VLLCGGLLVLLPPLLLLLEVMVVAVVLWLMVGGRLLLLVLACAGPQLRVFVLLVLPHNVLLLMLLHVLVLVGDRRLLFQLGDSDMLLVGPLVLSLVVLLVLW